MTLCRWFNILDPKELHARLTPHAYVKWLKYYERNACHPLALPLTLGISTYNVRGLAGKKNVVGTKAQDYVAYLPKTDRVDFNDPDAVIAALAKI